MALLSIVIPSRNEPYLKKTITDLLSKATEDIEIIVVLDGYWCSYDEIVTDKRVNYLHFTSVRGMRGAINAGVAVAKGKYILKTDAHCMFDKGFDAVLKADCKDDWAIVPRRKRLDPEKWELTETQKPDVDYMYLTYPREKDGFGKMEFSGREWTDKNKDAELKGKMIDDLMSFQGSCWFMKRDYFNFLELMDEERYGGFWKEAQEIGFKCWLSGGRVVVSKKTWYAHWHKTEGRGYSLAQEDTVEPNKNINAWLNTKWHKQTHPLSYLIKKFPDAPMWTPERIAEANYVPQ